MWTTLLARVAQSVGTQATMAKQSASNARLGSTDRSQECRIVPAVLSTPDALEALLSGLMWGTGHHPSRISRSFHHPTISALQRRLAWGAWSQRVKKATKGSVAVGATRHHTDLRRTHLYVSSAPTTGWRPSSLCGFSLEYLWRSK